MNRLSPFVGRVAELAVLEEALASAVLGKGRAVVLEGEPGIGKTRLATELGDRAERRGAGVQWAHCATDALAPAYWPFAQLLAPLYGARPEEDVLASFGPGAAAALALLGRGGSRVPDDGSPVGQQRFRLFDAVTTMLLAAAADRPLVLVFDDIHQADPGCLHLLVHLVRSLRAAPVLVLATMRTAEARGRDVAPILVGTLAREALVLPVDGWTPEEVGAFLAQARGRAPHAGASAARGGAMAVTADLARAVHRASAGNPFFVGEIAALLKPPAGAGSPHDEAFPVPAHVRQAVLARLDALPGALAGVLRAASVAGLTFESHVVASMLGSDEAGVAQSLAAAVDAGFLERGAASSWSFRHEIAREVLYDEEPAASRHVLHLACAASLSRSPRRTEGVAHHLLAALPAGDVAHAVRETLAAAEAAASTLAYERAAGWLRRGLEAIDRHGGARGRRGDADSTLLRGGATGGDAPDDELASLRGHLLLALGDASWGAGDLATSRASYEEAAELACAAGTTDAVLLARAALGAGGRQQRAHVQLDARVVELLERAITSITDDEAPLMARLHARLAYAIYAAPGSRAERERLCERALELARRSRDADTLRWVLGDCRWALWGPANRGERRAIGDELFAIAQRRGDREALLVEQGWRLVDALETGDRTALDQAFAAYRGGASELRLPWYQWYATRFACLVAQVEGRLHDAESLAAEAMAAGERAGHPDAALSFATQMLGIRLDQERAAELEGAAELSIAQYPDVLLWRRLLARIRIAQGREAEAAGEIERARTGPLVEAPGDFLHLPSLALLAEVAVAAGDDGVRARIEESFAAFSGQQVVLGFGMAFLGPVDLYLGELAAARGRADDARARLEAAAAQSERLGAARWAARARSALRALGRARADEQRGRFPIPGDVPAAAPRAGQRRSDAGGGTRGSVPDSVAALEADGTGWRAEFGGSSFRLGARRGVLYLHALLGAPDRELHVLELAALAGHGSATTGGAAAISDRADGGDTGPMLDEQAKRAYRTRLAELKADLDQAIDFADSGRMAVARAEIEALEDELARAIGLGGRDRRAGAAAERARVAVAKRIRNALERIGEQNVAMQRYLEGTIRTGTFCVYRPDPGRPVNWKL